MRKAIMTRSRLKNEDSFRMMTKVGLILKYKETNLNRKLKRSFSVLRLSRANRVFGRAAKCFSQENLSLMKKQL